MVDERDLSWMSNTTYFNNATEAPIMPILPCKWVLYEEILDSRVRIWDVAILVPNVFFILFLLLQVRQARRKLRQSNSPIFLAFLILVFANVLVGIIRCVVSMLVNAHLEVGDIADKVLWLLLRFFILFTEMSVIVFGLAFGHLDSRSSIKRVVLVTSAIALVYSGVQGVLEIVHPDPMFQVQSIGYNLFAHGGMIFWCISSALFTVVYATIFILPHTPIRSRIPLPARRSFYVYCISLAILNLIQCVGSILLLDGVDEGMCMVDGSTYIYFTCFTPLVYKVFLSEFFGSVNLSILFSYKPHQDEGEGEQDQLSLPHHTPSTLSTASAKTIDSASDHIMFANSALYDSTHFTSPYQSPGGQPTTTLGSINPLYAIKQPMRVDIDGGYMDDTVSSPLDITFHPVASNQHSLASNQPSIASNQPSIASNQPSIASNQPSIASNQPSIASNQPSIASNQPSIASNQPSIASNQHSLAPNQPSLALNNPSIASQDASLMSANPSPVYTDPSSQPGHGSADDRQHKDTDINASHHANPVI